MQSFLPLSHRLMSRSLTTYLKIGFSLFLLVFLTAEVQAQISATATLGVGQSHNGALSSSDAAIEAGNYVQCFNLNLQPNQEVVVTLRSNDFDTTIFAGTGQCGSVNLTMENDDFETGSTDSQLRFVPTQSNYVVAVSSYGAGETGNFTLSVTAGGKTTETQNNGAQPIFHVGSINAGQQYSGTLTSNSLTIDSGEHVQCIDLNAQPNKAVTVTLRSNEFDSYLFIGPGVCSGDFDLTFENDDFESNSTDSQITFTPTQAPYAVMITSYGPGETGSYTLVVE